MTDSKVPDTNNISGEVSFQKGNINFDLLEPEYPSEKEARQDNKDLKESIPNKRGIFDAGLKIKPVGRIQIFFWLCIFAGSASLLLHIVFIAQSLFWVLILPLILISLLWSFIMLILFKVRPR
ncbi:MAG: hypothetical protein OEV66_03520 [Spirochaetia bacterium]|nr:hypothetical protein [Spirochaetia bacterium]